MKRIIPTLAIVGLLLTGCVSGNANTNNDVLLHEVSITLKDGREITCVKYSAHNQGGLSCDWNDAKEQR